MKNKIKQTAHAVLMIAFVVFFSGCAEWKKMQYEKSVRKAVDKIFSDSVMQERTYARMLDKKNFPDSIKIVQGKTIFERDTLYTDTMYVDIPVPYEVLHYRDRYFTKVDTAQIFQVAELRKMNEYAQRLETRVLSLETVINELKEILKQETKRANEAENETRRLKNKIAFGFLAMIALFVLFMVAKSRGWLFSWIGKIK